MQDDFELDRIVSELKKYKTETSSKNSKQSFGDSFVKKLVRDSDQDISLGEYLQAHCEDEELFPSDKLYGLLNELDEEQDMDELELERYDLSSINATQRKVFEKNLFINHKNKVRQSSDKRINAYANSHAKLAKEASMRPLSLKRYSDD